MKKNASIGDLVYLSGNSEFGKAKKKKEKGKVKKKAAKYVLAPTRAAFLVLIDLNVLKLATKLARMWNTPDGKIALNNFWVKKFSGDITKLKTAIAKGSKQQLSSVGVAVETMVAAALPIVIAVVPLIKQFKADGDAKEQKELLDGVNAGTDAATNDPDIPKTSATFPVGNQVATLQPTPKTKGDGTEADTLLTPKNIGLGLGAAAILYVALKK